MEGRAGGPATARGRAGPQQEANAGTLAPHLLLLRRGPGPEGRARREVSGGSPLARGDAPLLPSLARRRAARARRRPAAARRLLACVRRGGSLRGAALSHAPKEPAPPLRLALVRARAEGGTGVGSRQEELLVRAGPARQGYSA